MAGFRICRSRNWNPVQPWIKVLLVAQYLSNLPNLVARSAFFSASMEHPSYHKNTVPDFTSCCNCEPGTWNFFQGQMPYLSPNPQRQNTTASRSVYYLARCRSLDDCSTIIDMCTYCRCANIKWQYEGLGCSVDRISRHYQATAYKHNIHVNIHRVLKTGYRAAIELTLTILW